MKMLELLLVVAFAAAVAYAIPLENRDATLPTFLRVACPEEYSNFHLCVSVHFNDAEESHDLLVAREKPDAPTVLKGHLKTNPRTKVVIILADEDNSEDTIVFRSNKVPGCTRFSVDISGSGESTCLNQAPLPPNRNHTDELMRSDVMGRGEPMPNDRSLFERQMFPRSLDPNGYKLNVVVHYDDMFKDEFQDRAVTRVEAIMAIVDEMYSEQDTLKTTLEVNLVATVYAEGQNWGTVANWNSILNDEGLGQIAADSGYDANSYVFLTGSGSQDGLGLAWLSVVCNPSKNRRINVNKYAAGSQKGGDAYTAETIAHEMGHNLGMEHDCLNSNCAYWSSSYVGPRQLDGEDCYGYMDYKDDTNYWSACSVSDFTDYINRQSTFCLEPLDGSGTGGNGGGSTDCFDVGTTTKIYANENSWSIGTCTSDQTYANNNVFTQQCCLADGDYTITCTDSYGDGWHGGYLEINGQKYCDDFSSGSSKEADLTIGTSSATEVCFNTKLTTKAYGNEVSWSFGSCASAAPGSYGSNREYPEQCCLTPGEYTLTCKDSYGDGWHGGFIEIQGSKYCEDFTSSNEMTKQVTIAAAA